MKGLHAGGGAHEWGYMQEKFGPRGPREEGHTKSVSCSHPPSSKVTAREHKSGRIPSHRASQKLSIGSFGGKFNFLPLVGVPARFYDIPPYKHKSR